jgi:hypothetical protein
MGSSVAVPKAAQSSTAVPSSSPSDAAAAAGGGNEALLADDAAQEPVSADFLSQGVRPAHVVFVHSSSSAHAAAAAEQLSVISLCDRVRRLQDALNPTGWQHQLQKLITLFEGATAGYQQWEQQQHEQQHQQQLRASEGVKGAEATSSKSGYQEEVSTSRGCTASSVGKSYVGFWGWCSSKLVTLVEQLATLTKVLLEELPDSYFRPGQQNQSMQVRRFSCTSEWVSSPAKEKLGCLGGWIQQEH